jgi:hypothetical protein
MPNGGSRDAKSLGLLSVDRKRELISQKRSFYASRQRKTSAAPAKPSNVNAPEVLPQDPKVPFFTTATRTRLSGEAAADQRTSIKYVFEHVLDSPPKDAWLELGTVTDIIRILKMPKGSWGTVYRVLDAIESDPACDIRAEAQGKGRPAEIVDNTEQAEFIYKALEAGNSIGTTTILLNNMFRKPRLMRNLSYATVARFVHQSPMIVIARRKTRKSGKEDCGTTWAQARVAFAKQLQEQLELGRLAPELRDARESPFPPLYLHAIAWWDEHHKKVILGHSSKLEARVYRNAEGKAASPEDGGVLPAERPRISVKYPGEARLLFGIAMVLDEHGIPKGKKAEPFGYTGCQILGIPAYNKECDNEMRRVRTLKKYVSFILEL